MLTINRSSRKEESTVSKLIVKNLDKTITEENLKEMVADYKDVQIKIIPGEVENKAILTFADEKECEACSEKYKDIELNGKKLEVAVMKKKTREIHRRINRRFRNRRLDRIRHLRHLRRFRRFGERRDRRYRDNRRRDRYFMEGRRTEDSFRRRFDRRRRPGRMGLARRLERSDYRLEEYFK